MKKQVALICSWLYDSYGNKITYGGSQKYTIALARLLCQNGWEVRIFQRSLRKYSNTIDNIPVKGIAVSDSWWGINEYSMKVYKELYNGELAIYVYMEAAFPKVHHPSIAVQHGINWSNTNIKRGLFNTYILQPKLLKELDAIVCVDTAYINWAHTQISNEMYLAKKLYYVPNFVDINIFKSDRTLLNTNKKIILFPRRLEWHRGPLLLLDAMQLLWEHGRDYHVIFCGSGNLKEEIINKVKLINKLDFIEIVEMEFNEMSKIYAKSDVSIIPTVAFEGTSLSCLESMASGIPVIVTHIGGLGNIVIPNYNVMCVDMNPKSLAESIDRVLQDNDLWGKLSQNGISTAEALNSKSWEKKWINIIEKVTRNNQ
jgi:glycosyltransferase involved in cell wall biosynthesis